MFLEPWAWSVFTLVALCCLVFCTIRYKWKSVRAFGAGGEWISFLRFFPLLSPTPQRAVRWGGWSIGLGVTRFCHRFKLGLVFPSLDLSFLILSMRGLGSMILLGVLWIWVQTRLDAFSCVPFFGSGNGEEKSRQQSPCISQNVPPS